MTAHPLDVPFVLANPWPFPLHGLPLRASIPLPQGAVQDPAMELALVDENRCDVHAQWHVLSRWKDGSARHALLNYAQPRLDPRATKNLRLVTRRLPGGVEVAPAPAPDDGIRVTHHGDDLVIDTGRLCWTLSKSTFGLARSIRAFGREWAATNAKGATGDLITLDTHGQRYRASRGKCRVTLEEQGPHRVIVLIEGDHQNALARFMDYRLRLHFSRGGSQVLLSHTIRNRHGGREGRDVARAGLVADFNVSARAQRRLIHAVRTVVTKQVPIIVPENVDLDVKPAETAIRHVPSLREDENDVCYSLRTGSNGHTRAGCLPLIDLHEPGVGGVLVKFAMPQPNEEFPMRLGSEDNTLEVDFYPAPPASTESMHLGEGMGKTRDFLLNFHDDSLDMMNLVHESNNLAYPGMTAIPRRFYREAKFADVHRLLEYQPNKYPMVEVKIEHTLSEGPRGEKSGNKPTPILSATGWRDFGDVVGFRGNMLEQGIRQFINNEEDYIYCSMLDAWRLGKPHGTPRVPRHLMDIDYIDYSDDPSRDGADCPHSTNHTDGETYPSHQWCQGLLYYYLATGDHEALRISKRIGDNLIWWLTGPRQESVTLSGREGAWPLLSLAALYDVTGDRRYFDAGMTIVDMYLKSLNEHGQLMFEYPPGSGIFSSYMLAMTFNGVWDMYACSGDQRILDLWKRITKPTIDALENPDSVGYIHFRNAQIKWPDLTTLARWYHLTGDDRYVRLGKNGLKLVLAGCPQPLLQEISYLAMGYRHYIQYLQLADEFGMINDDACNLVW